MQNITPKQVKYVVKNLDLEQMTALVKETYGYNTTWTCTVSEANSGQAHDNSKPGFVFLGSDYVGKVVQDEASKRYYIHLDARDNDEFYILHPKAKVEKVTMPSLEDIEAVIKETKTTTVEVNGAMEQLAMNTDNPEETLQQITKVKSALENNKESKNMSSNTVVENVLKGTIFECNVPKNQTVKGKVTLFVTKRYQNMEITLAKLEERAQARLSSLSGTQRLKKAFVMEVNGEAVVIKTVVKEGKLVMETITGVPFETLNLLKSKF